MQYTLYDDYIVTLDIKVHVKEILFNLHYILILNK